METAFAFLRAQSQVRREKFLTQRGMILPVNKMSGCPNRDFSAKLRQIF
jgi:hypothetical protein